MPPQLQQLLENKRLVAAIAVLAVLIIGGVAIMGAMGSGDSGGKKDLCSQKITKDQIALTTIKGNEGKALEIQALLARHGIHLKHISDEQKVTLEFQEDTTLCERDTAMLTLVQSGLMDRNVGLEAFDKGDLTASREEKRIKLIRAQQGELARLIRKIDPIEDAAVSISIPEQTLFRSEEKPLSASVQVSMPVGERLTRDKVRAISNLMVGSIQGLGSNNLSISDTNGNTYSSVLDPGTDIDDRLQEQDNYMKQKVAAQLDRLVGTGNYVVTVSTELRQAPRETMVQSFDPQGGVVSSKQSFNENLNTNGSGPGAGGPASSMLPNALSTAVMGAGNSKDYLRNGVEVTYNNSKTQWVETRPVGMIEDISIAVTVDSSHFPSGMSVNELQSLLASAASPKVRPERVSIARSELPRMESLNHADGPAEAAPDLTWLYWAGGAVAFCILMIMLLSMRKGGGDVSDAEFERTQRELANLRDITHQQQAQLQATQQQTQMLLEAQQRQVQQPQAMDSGMTDPQNRLTGGNGLQQTLEELREVVTSEDLEEDNLSLQIKSWIESS